MKMPKLCHFYWGGGPLSYLQYLSIESFKKHNPDWQINLFTPKVSNDQSPTWESKEQAQKYTGKDYLHKAKELCQVKVVDFEALGVNPNVHEVHKSDLIRWQILYECGGVWSDIDILYIKPLDELLDLLGVLGTDTTVTYDSEGFVIGFFITKPHQLIFKDIFATAHNRVNFSGGYQHIGAKLMEEMFEGPTHLARYRISANITNLPLSVIYPYSWKSKDLKILFHGSINKIQPNTVGVHWYNGSEEAKIYQNNFEVYKNNNSVMSKLVKEYI